MVKHSCTLGLEGYGADTEEEGELEYRELDLEIVKCHLPCKCYSHVRFWSRNASCYQANVI